MSLKLFGSQVVTAHAVGAGTEAIDGLPAHHAAADAAERRRFRVSTQLSLWLVVALYLCGAIALTWQLWADLGRAQVVPSNGVSRDIDLFAWCMRHVATAIAHGRLPALVTPDLNAPVGINLMWNTSFLLPATLFAPLTLLAGPQASLDVLLTLGFAGTATTAFWVIRRWGTSVPAAALGGAAFGFSPALRIAAVGHDHLQFAVLVPLIADALLRLLTGRNGLPRPGEGPRPPLRPVRTGALLGVLLAAQLFIAEETLALLGVAALVVVVVLAASRPRAVVARIRPVAAGLAAAAGTFLVLCGYGLWRQFYGPLTEHGSPWTTSDFYNHTGDFVHAPSGLLFQSATTVHYLSSRPVRMVEYFAYLGWPLLVVLLIAAIAFWRDLRVRTMAVTFAALELFGLGAPPVAHGLAVPAALLPWRYLRALPLLDQIITNRFSLLADGAAAALLAIAVDLAVQRAVERRATGPVWRAWWAHMFAAAAAVALVPIIPKPLQTAPVRAAPAGWKQTFSKLRLTESSRLLILPLRPAADMRWQADTDVPGALIGCYGNAPGPGGKATTCQTQKRATAYYLNALSRGERRRIAPSAARVRADFDYWRPAAMVAVTGRDSPLGVYLTRTFGPPSVQRRGILAWRHRGRGWVRPGA